MLRKIRRALPRDPWWHVVGLSLGGVFSLLLAVARLAPQYLEAIDRQVETIIAPFQAEPYVSAALVITVLGSGLGVTLVGLGAALFLRRSPRALLQVFLVLLFASTSMGSAKAFVERARPQAVPWVEPLTTFSFPSGHATLVTALYGFLAVAAYRRARERRWRVLATALPSLVILLVALSRVILGYHYFTDVVAGMLLGLFWLAVVFMLPRTL